MPIPPKIPATEFESLRLHHTRLCISEPCIFKELKLPNILPKSDLPLPKDLHAIHLVHYQMDITKKWYIDVHFIDSASKTLVRKKYCKGINKYNTAPERKYQAELIIQRLIEMMHNGFRFTRTSKFEDLKPDLQDLSKLTFQKAFTDFIASKTNLEIQTIRRYKASLKYLSDYEKGHKPVLLKNVETPHVSKLLQYIQETRKIEPKTFNHYRNTYAAVFNHYKKQGILTRNPVDAIASMKVTLGQMHHPLEIGQVSKIKQFATRDGDHQFTLFISFCFYALVRPGKELRLLKVKDILEDSFWVCAENSKPGQARRIEMLKPLKKAITDLQIKTYNPDFYVFTLDGKPGKTNVGKSYFYRTQVKYLAELNLTGKKHDLYCYKHSGAIQMIKAGFTPFEVMKIAGHKDVQQTMEYLYNIGAISMLNGKGDNMPEI